MVPQRTPVVVPKAFDYAKNMPTDLSMMGNDGWGDCVEAGSYHARQVWSFTANPPMNTQPDSTVLQAYSEATGFNPNDPSTDQGTDMQSYYDYWQKTGLPLSDGSRDKLLLPPVELDIRNLFEVREAIYECGSIQIGFSVPQYLEDSSFPEVWDTSRSGSQTIIGGHCVCVTGASQTQPTCEWSLISWGLHNYMMTGRFWSKFVEEAWVLIDREWLEKTGKTPLGLTLPQWEQLAQTL